MNAADNWEGKEEMLAELRAALLLVTLLVWLGLDESRAAWWLHRAQRAVWREYGYADVPQDWRCPCCGGCSHPASGCQYAADIVVCGPCTRSFWRWAVHHVNKMPGKRARHRVSFYEAAGARPLDEGAAG